MREIERVILLRVIDRKWMEHIDDMDQLRQGIGLQAFGNRNPVIEYKMTGYDMFNEMTEAIEEDTVRLLLHVQIEQKIEREQVAKVTGTNKDDSVAKAPVRRETKKIQRNDPCPCGSGLKYKTVADVMHNSRIYREGVADPFLFVNYVDRTNEYLI